MIESQVATRTAPAHVDVEWVSRGRRDRRDALEVVDVAFESADLVRRPSSWQHKRNYEGYYWAATTGTHVWFESLFERAALMRLDRDRHVVGVAAQPMWIHWSGSGRKHAPDFFVRYRDGRGALVDVKPAQYIGYDDAEAFRRTRELCGRLGWEYLVVSDIAATEHRNLRFLSGYRFDRWGSPVVNAQLRDRSGERRTLQAWAEILDGACELPLGAVYSAVWWGSLKVDEISPLALSSVAAA
ncbi:TnsA-like heteromeric transposase endonuclease subunit [Microbacterium flavum]|uniref:TnsA-like heteromeric transposase endonuclease subunit n=1 Tax=Microbacterium flavum TaxID=415216 RepID=UPI0024AE7100|nr:TnsA-like heteromeric transposase endonuclease subunit [Microbacterium flavum]